MTQQRFSPLVNSIVVNCSPAAAFDLWTQRPSAWWPIRDHSLSGDTAEAIVFESFADGRIYERDVSGNEHQLGRIVRWNPPVSFNFLWHIYGVEHEATDVEIRFEPVDADRTRVIITHSGWERLGERSNLLRRNNQIGWTDLLEAFANAVSRSE